MSKLRVVVMGAALCAAACGPEGGTAEEPSGTTSQAAVCADCEPGGGGGGGYDSNGTYPVVTFWEGNGCTQDQVGWFSAASLPTTIPNTSGSGWVNDEARSMLLTNIKAGTVIRVYDNGSGSTSDDWAEIRVNRNIESRCVYSFQLSNQDADFTLNVHYRDGLDGKVSRVTIQ
jgi:hypothetical protein